MLFQLFCVLFGIKREADHNKRLKDSVVCILCQTEQPKASKFCRKCGSPSLISFGDSIEHGKRKRDQELERLHHLGEQNAAIKRIRHLETCTFCDKCDQFFEDSPSFCPYCGDSVEGRMMTEEVIFHTLLTEYPRVVKTNADYMALRAMPIDDSVEKRQLSLALKPLKDFLTGADQTKPTFLGNTNTEWMVMTLLVLIFMAVMWYLMSMD